MSKKITEIIHPSWLELFRKNGSNLKAFLKTLPSATLSPRVDKIFNCFSLGVKDIKLVIVGQDPYPSANHATGWAFDVPEGTTRQSFIILQNIAREYGIELDTLDRIKDQVLLLNTNLTTRAGITKAHDWIWFTKQVVDYVKANNPDCGFAFMGNYAKDNLNSDLIQGHNFYHPIANARSGKQKLNTDFFHTTSQYVDWKTIYPNVEKDT